jgi:hypothetical protein
MLLMGSGGRPDSLKVRGALSSIKKTASGNSFNIPAIKT